MTSNRPDVGRVLASLKDFQRKSVDYVFRRLFLDTDSTHRFLVADEVGLGKTLVARGVIAQTLDHLWDQVDRIDIIYICSNADIARQNINRLNVLDHDVALPSRLTLLPVTIHNLKQNRVNFVSLTPGTSFDLRSSMGTGDERILLYWLLKDIWALRGRGAQSLLQGDIQDRQRFGQRLKAFDRSLVDEALAGEFEVSIRRHIDAARGSDAPDLRTRFETCADAHAKTRTATAQRAERAKIVAELRGLLAATCLESLEPDLIVLDEFQRFKHLMTGESEAAELAKGLFEYSDEVSRARVLLLSATPYKMYTLGGESGVDDHYRDFIDTLRFLLNDDRELARVQATVDSHRRELLALQADGHDARHALEAELRRVIVRTERLAVTSDRQGMLVQIGSEHLRLERTDVSSYLGLQEIARALDHPDTMEYWKSAPYVLNFMDAYQLKRDFERARARAEESDVAQALSNGRTAILLWKDVVAYNAVDPRNARLRDLVASTVGRGAWRLLWIPPAMPYYPPRGAFGNPLLASFTKRLIFSSWVVVPKTIACLVSYEAERHAIRAVDPDARNTTRDRDRRSGLLRFTRSEERLTGMPVLTLLYPSIVLAQLCDPLELQAVDAEAAVRAASDRIRPALAELGSRPEEGPEDERWYWAAPMLLDVATHPSAARAWLARDRLASVWSGRETHDEESLWADHLAEARSVVDKPNDLGRIPSDLAETLAIVGLAAPATSAARSLARTIGDRAACTTDTVRDAAASVSWAFRTLFNLPEATGVVRAESGDAPYWRAALEYCLSGNLQAVLDEYAHVLRESLGLIDKNADEVVDSLASAIRDSLSIRTAAIRVDDISASKAQGTVNIATKSMRGRFALRFSQERSESDAEGARAEHVRQAFNSPFWPFVLATTSVGQEGLDFHTYCHAVVHWNLPSNPVDLEQREGRVHRYKGHAVRKNLANAHRAEGLAAGGDDPWEAMFEAARRARPSYENDLVPYWVFPGDAKIERHVPMLPLSRDVEQLESLRRSLAAYRMVFGQPRQDDLVAYLLNHLTEEEITRRADEFRVDLSPPS